MKDLAGQDFSKKSTVTIPRGFVKLAGVVVLVLAVLLFVKSHSGGSSGTSSSNSAVVLSEAPRGLTPVSVGDSNLSAKGVDLKTQNATMTVVRREVREVSGSAKATRSYGGGIFNLTVTANLPDPKTAYYQVWLTDGTKLVPIDFMRGSGSSWSLDLSDTNKYSQLDQIWITLERSKDNKPEEHIVEGSF